MASGADPSSDPAAVAARIAAGYRAEGPTIDVGRVVVDGVAHAEAAVAVPTAMCNRHGLIAGATGTGKTVTLQVLAEQLAAQGVSVFTADIKGDLTGLARPATPGDKVQARNQELGIDDAPTPSPVQFWALGGEGPGVPLRAAIGSFGPQLLAKVLDASEAQRSALAMAFHVADQQGLALVELADLAALLRHLTSDEGEALRKEVGGISSQTAGVLLRKLVELEQQGAEAFFGEPEVAVDHLIRVGADGRGTINCLELADVRDRPRLFSTFLMWLLAELFETLPEVGDLDRPKLVFFFDEAHLLFADAPDEFVEQVAQTVRLIRSKGVGVFFVTQLPGDVPDAVLAQLGTRVQHAIRAFTPRDAKALRAAVSTYPITEDYDLEELLTQLGIGDAVVTTLDPDGVPTPVAWTRVRPPRSQIGAVPPDEVRALAAGSDLWATYAEPLDRETAREVLAARTVTAEAPPPSPSSSPDDLVRDAGIDPDGLDVRVPPPRHAERAPARRRPAADDDPIGDFLRSREGRSTVRTVVRGVFDLLKKR